MFLNFLAPIAKLLLEAYFENKESPPVFVAARGGFSSIQ